MHTGLEIEPAIDPQLNFKLHFDESKAIFSNVIPLSRDKCQNKTHLRLINFYKFFCILYSFESINYCE